MSRVLIATILLLSTVHVSAQQVWTQKADLQPSQEQGASSTSNPATPPSIANSAFESEPTPEWIWGPDNGSSYVLSTTVSLSGIKAARLKASSDNVGSVYVNGRKVATSSEWSSPMDADVTSALVNGSNLIQAEVENQGGSAGFVFKLIVQNEAGELSQVVSDLTWTWSTERGQDSTEKVQSRGAYGSGPWGRVFDGASEPTRVPAGVFEVPPGFQVEKLFTVPKDELGSWVCITFDNKGRLLASDQGDLGICRITIPPADQPGGETRVERLDFSKCEFKPTAAQGMLYALDSLYFSINGGPGSGLYRARDLNGDDQFDECVRLKEFRGGGEHGPHALRLSPDGKRLFVICGNHTLPPFNPGEELTNQDYSSRIPTNWSEDHILPRMWDANGHARGIMAPGGWIASTDADGKTWDIWSIGYRNPYDMAFNADGELFAYDADMEWDVGMPWYRPTRVVHATSGSEFGWRSGSGKWPNHYVDSLPPLVNIGPGSPVGVEFGYGTRFPAKFQKALYLCDWTFGTMYAIHMTPSQSSYTAVKEEFLSRTPLPLTDVVVGPDGLLYFSIGGRGTQSELFRVRYTGPESTEPVELRNSEGAGPRSRRHVIESWHAGRNAEGLQPRISADVFMSGLENDVRSGDRFLKSAVREGFYNSQLFLDMMSAPHLDELDLSQSSAEDRMSIVVTLAKAPLKVVAHATGLNEDQVSEQEEMLHRLTTKTLLGIRFSTLTEEQRLLYLRALSLVFLRLGPPSSAQREQFVADIDSSFPSNNMELNRELCQVLVYLKSPTIVAKAVALLDAPSVPTVTDEMKDLLSRNRGYGNAIAASIESAPDQQQIWYAFCLRNVKEGWTMDQRRIYFSWFERAHKWAGGASFHGFLRNIETEAFENASEKERLLIEASGARKPYTLPEIPKPAGPGKDWTLEEVRALAETELRERDFENGQKMFAATRCIICHRFAGDGGATGPDLTQLAGRFNVRDLTEAIMQPSKVISDQYKGSTVLTTSGKAYSGRIVSESETSVTILTNPEDPTKVTEIPKSEVDEIQPATVSLMPADLLKPLNRDEVLDLLAYLLSRGDKGSGMFRNK